MLKATTMTPIIVPFDFSNGFDYRIISIKD